MHNLYFEKLQETLYHEQLENGLDVYILPKKGFSKTFVTFTTKYGSIDRTFIPKNEQEEVTVPDGIAHFLEHKMFEKEDGDVFQNFSKLGGSANAFTSFTRTAYLFSATENVYDNTAELLDFVQQPYFTEETVEKEKGIIAQEITMYDDMPDWLLYFGTIENMYHEHPVKIDIAGTVESINDITADHLYTCYDTFYHPSNMVLFVVGAVQPEEMMQFIKDNQDHKTFEPAIPITRSFQNEPKTVAIQERSIEMDVKKPKLSFGMKCNDVHMSGSEMLTQELAAELLFDIVFGRTSSFYKEAYESSLIDESYAYSYSQEDGFGFAIIASDTEEPDALAETICATLRALKTNWTVTEADLESIRKRKIGQFLRALNSIEFIANQFTRYRFNEMDLFDILPTLENITIADLQQAFATISDEETHTVFKVLPKETVEQHD